MVRKEIYSGSVSPFFHDYFLFLHYQNISQTINTIILTGYTKPINHISSDQSLNHSIPPRVNTHLQNLNIMSSTYMYQNQSSEMYEGDTMSSHHETFFSPSEYARIMRDHTQHQLEKATSRSGSISSTSSTDTYSRRHKDTTVGGSVTKPTTLRGGATENSSTDSQ